MRRTLFRRRGETEEVCAPTFSVDGARKVNGADFPTVGLLVAMGTSVNMGPGAGTPMGSLQE